MSKLSPKAPKQTIGFILNLISCIIGAVIILLFAWGVERNDSFATDLLKKTLHYSGIVIGGLFLLGVMIVGYFMLRKGKAGN